MRKKKFTPGPWSIMNSGASWLIYGPLGERICKMLYPERHAIRKANANLIAAAPELLEALEGLLLHYTSMVDSGDCGSWDPEEDEDVVQSRIAIAKVYGE